MMSNGARRSDGLPPPQRYMAAIAIWAAIAMSVLDSAIANIALPTIARDLGVTPPVSVWVINAYQLTITILLIPLAAMGDRIGHYRIYLPGIGMFIAGSLTCALADNFSILITGRVIQGAGAAGIMSMNAAMVRSIYPSEMLGRGMGYNALVLSVSAAVGPTLAAAILSIADWPWLFAINVPVGLIAVYIGNRSLPRTDGHGREPDYVAAGMSAAAMGMVVFGGETFAREGARGGLFLLLMGLGIGFLLVRREWNKPSPLVPLDLLRIPIFALSIATSLISFSAQTLAFVTMPFLLQNIYRLSVVESGLLMTPWPLAVGCVAPLSGRLADRYSAGILGAIGLVLFAAGLFSLSQLGQNPAAIDIVWRMALCGAGFGIFQSPNNRAMMSVTPRERSGAAGGMLATARLLGQTTGAVAVASAFHWAGLGSSPTLLACAASAALIAAIVSVMRVRVTHRSDDPSSPIVDM